MAYASARILQANSTAISIIHPNVCFRAADGIRIPPSVSALSQPRLRKRVQEQFSSPTRLSLVDLLFHILPQPNSCRPPGGELRACAVVFGGVSGEEGREENRGARGKRVTQIFRILVVQAARHAPIAFFRFQTSFLVRCPLSPPSPCPSFQHSRQYESSSQPRQTSTASLLHMPNVGGQPLCEMTETGKFRCRIVTEVL